MTVMGILTTTPAANATTEPSLQVSAATVRASLHCYGNAATSALEPVLFLHGTTSDSQADFSWNWNRAFQQHHWAYCDLDTPNHADGDIQVAAQYVVVAIRLMHQAGGGRRIGIVGHSQGGMIGRWALKYWPDTRAMVADYVGLASSNHGTADFNVLCGLPVGCPAAFWQQRQGSRFLAALNTGPQTWPGISYTEIADPLDEIVVPYTSPFLPAASNVTNLTINQICPTALAEHFSMSAINAAWLAGLDALVHAGPAVLPRISKSTCANPLMPGVDLVGLPTNALTAGLTSALSAATGPYISSEPPLAAYAR